LAEIQAVLSSPSTNDGLPDATVTDALNSEVITKLRQQYLDNKKRASEWASRYGQTHQAVADLRSDMAAVKRAIYEEMQRIAETYKSDLKVARAREEAIGKQLIEVFQSNSEERQSQAKLQELQTAANSYRSIYETFLTRYTQAVQQQSFPSTEARVISPAAVGKKTSPKIALALALALAGGGILGMGAAFARERMDSVVYSKTQLVRELGVSCIAVLPAAARRTSLASFARFRRVNNEAQPDAAPGASPSTKPADAPALLYKKEDPFSAISETLLNIKVAADIRSISHETRSLALVSALPGEGKSSISSSLAAAVAGSSRKVLLIDCDLRNPSLTRFFGSENRPGVLELLQGFGTIEESVTRIDRYGFDFLCAPSKVPPVHTADLLNSEAMGKLLAGAKERYDYLVIDLPPVITVSDVRACAHLFDSFAFVVEWGKTTTDDLIEAMHIAPIVYDRLLGFVLNKVDPKFMRQAEGYGQKYGRYVR
jgi:capsular exopolysaccharide synthesis family protein